MNPTWQSRIADMILALVVACLATPVVLVSSTVLMWIARALGK